MMASTATLLDDDVYELPTMAASGIPTPWQSAAAYTLESPVRCPHCRQEITTIRIVGLTRSQVAFTSTLPRKGRVIICGECERILSAELSGLV
jgi:hypothetical protein